MSEPNTQTTQPFYEGYQDAELRGFLTEKGFKSSEDVAKSYRHLESHMGVPADRLLKLPSEPDSPEWASIRARIGFEVPETADGYEVDVPEGLDTEYANNVKNWAKELGIPKSMLKGLAEKQNSYIEEMQTKAHERLQAKSQIELDELKASWGNKFEASMELARRASADIGKLSGMTIEDLGAMEQALGTGKFLRLWANLGSKTQAEPTLHGGSGDNGAGFGITPDVAKSRIAALQKDREFFKKFESGDSKALEEWKYLNRIASGV